MSDKIDRIIIAEDKIKANLKGKNDKTGYK